MHPMNKSRAFVASADPKCDEQVEGHDRLGAGAQCGFCPLLSPPSRNTNELRMDL